MCDMLVERPHKTEYLCGRPMSLAPELLLAQMINELHSSFCNKLISKSAYIRTGVRLMPGLNCCEDQYVIIALLSHNITVAYLDVALYHYDKTANNNSITNKWLEFPVKNRIYFIKSIASFIKTPFQKQAYINYIGAVAYNATASPRSACPNYRELFKEYQYQIVHSQIPLHKRFISLVRIYGVYIPTRFLRMTRKYIHSKLNK